MVEEPIRCPFDTQTVFRAMQAWGPEYIAQACPFITCTIVGPSLDMIRTALHADKASDHDHHIQLIKLVLRRIGRYWDIGNCALSELYPRSGVTIALQSTRDIASTDT